MRENLNETNVLRPSKHYQEREVTIFERTSEDFVHDIHKFNTQSLFLQNRILFQNSISTM